MTAAIPVLNEDVKAKLDADLAVLEANKQIWAQTSNAQRIAFLSQIRDKLNTHAQDWVTTACRKKGIPEGSPLAGEEWTSGPYPVMSMCNHLIQTLSGLEGKQHIKSLPTRKLPNGQLAVKVLPHAIWDHFLLSGVTSEVWMQKGITADNLAANTASSYDIPPEQREGAVSLVLGAGNIASISPLDAFQKLFVEHQTVMLKMNPVNDYLVEFLEPVLKPLIDFGVLRIVKGGIEEGSYLCKHPLISELHITGSEASHDAIVWGLGDEAVQNKQSGTPQNDKRITSELGAVCPTIVVPGPWNDADIRFQADNIATMKMHNSGFNCVACQVLIMPTNWNKAEQLNQQVEQAIQNAPQRELYYPGAANRQEQFCSVDTQVKRINRQGNDCVINEISADSDTALLNTEYFCPAMSVMQIEGSESDPEAYLVKAIEFANEQLHGTLGANVLIHPATIKAIGKQRFDEILLDLHYGCIAINTWTGLSFLLSPNPWGAFPGHTLDDVQSGIGLVHNSYMFDKPERTVVQCPWQPFPRNLLSLGYTLLPRPPWFVSNKQAHVIGKLLTEFQYKPSFLKLPKIFFYALRG